VVGGSGFLAEGYIGRIRDAQFSMPADYGDDLVGQWRFDPNRGTGILGDLGSHMIDMARWYVGEIVGVSGRLATPDAVRPTPDGEAVAPFLNVSATALLEFEGGASGTIQVSGARVTPGWLIEMGLFGDEGSLKLECGPDTEGRVRGCRRGDESWSDLAVPPEFLGTAGPNPSILNLPSLAPFTNKSVADRLFVDAVLDGTPAEPTFEDGWRVQEVIDAVVTSDRRGCWVAVAG
jgi:predicted dehydrogenase